MQKLIDWCKKEWLLFATCFLTAFIPLYPKLPLFDVVQTWVYVRLEDLIIGVVAIIFLVSLWKRRLFPATALTTPIVTYWVVGAVCLIYSLLFIGPTLQGFFPHLAILHYLRRIEYMGLFFIGYYAVVKKPSNVSAVIWTLSLTTLGIIIYGIGQKFLGFPAFLTMNEEFSKGVPLRLPPTARIASTFGGHYDLGAYLVFIIPLLGSLIFTVSKVWQKLGLFILTVCSFVILLFTASRVSFGVYLVAISTMLWWRRKSIWIVPVVIVSFVLLNYVSGASERFYKTFRFSDVVVDLSTGQPIGTLDQLEGGKAKIAQQESPAKESLPTGSEFISVPQIAATKPAKTVKTVEIITSNELATGSGEIATVSGNFLIQKAFVYDISITTRFQGQWPKAMEAFGRNVLFGSGYSTLSVAADGDYLRMLGETGVLGTIAFLGVFLMAFYLYFRRREALPPMAFAFTSGLFAGIVGLFLNAILIDVFEASKVAFTLWLFLGVGVALMVGSPGIKTSYWHVLWSALVSRVAIILYLFAAVFIFYGKALQIYFLGDDFTWLRWAASSTLSDLPRYFVDSSGFFYRPIPKLFYFFLYTFFWLKPWAYHIASLLLFWIITTCIFALVMTQRVRKWVALLGALLFASLAVHHENVIWISGMSGLLSAVFLFVALLLLARERKAWGVGYALRMGFVWILVLFSAFSYEGGLIAPVLAWYVATAVYGLWSIETSGMLLLVPLYWWIRTAAHAVPPSGDYGVKSNTFVLNVVANSVGYMLASVGGPRLVELFTALRGSLRQYFWPLAAVVTFAGAIMVLLGRRFAAFFRKESIRWLGAFFIALIPFLGLGGMAERYVLVASGFLVIAASVAVDRLWNRANRLPAAIATIGMIVVLVGNAIALGHIMNDWMKAGNVAETAVLSIKKKFFPLQDKHVFVFVNTPIRYGRAWIFPTGLSDALWHMFKFNTHPYAVYTASSVDQAFKEKYPLSGPTVLVFDGFTLKIAHQEVKTIEVDNP